MMERAVTMRMAMTTKRPEEVQVALIGSEEGVVSEGEEVKLRAGIILSVV